MKKMVVLLGMIFLLSVTSAWADDEFEALFAGQQTVDGSNALAVTFSEPVDTRQNLAPYFSVLASDDTPLEGSWVISKDPQILYFTNIEPANQYTIVILKGLKAASGSRLETAREFSVTTREITPAISFADKGFILASRLNQGLPVISMNIDKADIDFFRIKPDFIDEFRGDFAGTEQMYHHYSGTLKQYADLVYTGRWDIRIKKDLRTEVNLSVNTIEPLSTPGVYFAVLRGAGHYDYSMSCTWFTISDIGVHARRYQNRVQFQSQSLETAKPLENVTIDGYDTDGNVLFDTKTDSDGLAVENGAFEDLAYVIARSGDSVSVLPMNVPALDLSEFRTAVEPFRPVELYVYGPRDLYRPGETLTLNGLLRNQDGEMAARIPVSGSVIQPDGRVVHEFTWKGRDLNYYHYDYTLPSDALTGRWRIAFKRAGADLKEYGFIVSDFLPERMKLAVNNPEGQGDILDRKASVSIEVKGDYLYGAPAAGGKADAAVRLTPARELFREKWPGYEFGDAAVTWSQSYKTGPVTLDDDGKARLTIDNEWKDSDIPLWLTADISLYDSGGRPVVRTKSWQIWPADTLAGIRLLTENSQVPGNSTAQFDIIAVDKNGERIPIDGLEAVVIREHREYYWEYRNDRWQWHHTSQFYPIDRFTLDVGTTTPASVSIPVEWGGYRLEIRNRETGLVSSKSFWAGWLPEGPASGQPANRPDRVDLALDKPFYRAGDTAKITVTPPESGSGYLFVESDTNLVTLPVTVPAQGKTFEIKIDPSWDRHDLYVSALIVRQGKQRTHTLPKRSIGLIPLRLDRSDRKLAVAIDAPDTIEPDQTVDVSVRISHADGSKPKTAWVTLAAVDVGILNLSRFDTPDPHAFFFQGRKYSPRMHDLYQDLIEPNKGEWARLRFGGDMAALARGGDKPATDVQIVSISKQAVQIDETGHAVFAVAVPEFNGRLRIMAVAHTDRDFGSADRDLTVASPLTAQITMPRFLSMGDKSSLAVDVHNLTDSPQELDLEMTLTGPVQLLGQTSHSLTLAPKQKETRLFTVLAGQEIGRSDILLTVDGLKTDGQDRRIQRSWFIETRPPYPAVSRIFRPALSEGETFDIKPEGMTHLMPGTIGVQAVLSAEPPIDIAGHITRLDAYPYGCLEQTASGMFPHVLLSASDFARLGINQSSPDETDRKIRTGIQGLLEKQKSSGGFGLWHANSPENFWLTAYVTDFLLYAGQAGFEIPPKRLENALERLATYVRRPATVRPAPYSSARHERAAARVYAAFVLARVQQLSLGDARALYRDEMDDLPGLLGQVQAGLALCLSGDPAQGGDIIDTAIAGASETERDPHLFCGDYGSRVRDLAASYFLISRFFPEADHAGRLLVLLQEELDDREWLSTQEQNALVMAGSIRLTHPGKTWSATVLAGDRQKDLKQDTPGRMVSLNGESATGFSITNTGTDTLYLCVTLAGYPGQMPETENSGIRISRRYLSPGGDPVDVSQVASGDRMVIELAFEAQKRAPDGLLVDLLPACLELEDPSLSGSMVIDDIRVDQQPIVFWHKQLDLRHTEYRDDRFVAAVNIPEKTRLRIFYPVRVVTPGEFLVPPPLAEDMYKPFIRGIGETPPLIRVQNP
jgi:uncharacterized protein YfaS (alpha-2-macroglobulin family)